MKGIREHRKVSNKAERKRCREEEEEKKKKERIVLLSV